MLRYLLKRILLFIPTLLVISLLAFGLSKCAPGDPVESYNRASRDFSPDIRNRQRQYKETAHFLGLDKPSFYFAILPAAYPDTLYRIVDRNQRETLQKLIAQYGNWEYIADYYHQIQRLEFLLYNLPDSVTINEVSIVRSTVQELYVRHKDNQIAGTLQSIEQTMEKDLNLAVFAQKAFDGLKDSYAEVKAFATPSRLLIPDFKWYGSDNQYHHWFFNFLQGNFGTSYFDGRPVAHKLNDALRWTLVMNGIAIILAYLLSIPLGVFSAVRRNTLGERVVTVVLFMLYSLPVFWVATLLLIFFTTPEYGMDFFPSLGLGNLPATAPLGDRFLETAAHLFLPVFCLTYGSLAFISRQMRGGMLDVLQQDYIRTARAKGLHNRTIIWKHALRNALFPIITLFAAVFPAALAGSVVVEVIYNIPGMGKLTIDSINNRDWPVVYSVLMLSAVLTMVGILIADILYGLLDPRVSFAKK